ncbi:hypothetical protein SAMN05444287_0708 [Octadecabacter temperatus]|uniref:Uncharacterized protein n=1 Tax=Octadecabacter temperatus TaxID=1458307 RepID=A0A0K0Y420_9RHOB|nr:hypothetical protein [Octadecabacter temperatus]AKS45612.1 hypothetical protein OSB_10540 [Octadecabacter temperatus]SIN96818.1 hypothetical protein SAMN05444287_0708 [Octadecabacter temperatus]
MDASQNLPELVAAAQSAASASQSRIAAARAQPDSETAEADLTAAATEIGASAIDIFAVFEARMQRYFKRGPLSRKVKAALLDVGQADLADRLHQHYLMINVLKHGTGASHRELLGNKSTLVSAKSTDNDRDDAAAPHIDLIDVTQPGFFDTLAATILEAAAFLQNRNAP